MSTTLTPTKDGEPTTQADRQNIITILASPDPVMIATGYEPKTTFWQDFNIADAFSDQGIRDTFSRAFEEWKGNAVYLTELVMVLNHKIWQHYEGGHHRIAKLYDELWRTADEYAMKTLQGDDLQYYIRTLD